MVRPGGGIGRHAGLKILFAATRVTVQFRSGAQFEPLFMSGFFYLVQQIIVTLSLSPILPHLLLIFCSNSHCSLP